MFKVGNRVRIIDDLYTPYNVGDEGVIEDVPDDDYDIYGVWMNHAVTDASRTQLLAEDEIELVGTEAD